MSDLISGPLGGVPQTRPQGVKRITSTNARTPEEKSLVQLRSINKSISNVGIKLDDDTMERFEQMGTFGGGKGRGKTGKVGFTSSDDDGEDWFTSERKSRKEQTNIFKKIAHTLLEVPKKIGEGLGELGTGIKNLGHHLGESAFRTILGPISTLLGPIEEAAGVNVYESLFKRGGGRGGDHKGLFGKRKSKESEVTKVSIVEDKPEEKKMGSKDLKWKKGRPSRENILPISPETILLYDAITKDKGVEGEKKKGGLFGNLLGGLLPGAAGALGKLLPGLLRVLPVALPIMIILGTLAMDFFGKGGALEMFKKGKIGKGVLTLLLGKDLSKRSTMGQLLGIGEQGLKWGAVGFLIGGPLGALIGFGVGAAGAGIKLGFDSGWFKNKMMPWIQGALQNSGTWIRDQLTEPIKNFMSGIMKGIGDYFNNPNTLGGKVLSGIVSVSNWVYKNAVKPILSAIGGFFTTVSEKVTEFFNGPGSFLKDMFEKVKQSISDFFSSIGDFFGFIKQEGVIGAIRDIAEGKFGKKSSAYHVAESFGREATQDATTRQLLTQTTEYQRQRAQNPYSSDTQVLAATIQDFVKQIKKGAVNSTIVNNILKNEFSPDEVRSAMFAE